jgi:hypothetical protein
MGLCIRFYIPNKIRDWVLFTCVVSDAFWTLLARPYHK